MSAIDDLFTKLRREKRKALMPFVTAGDPDLAVHGRRAERSRRPRLPFVRGRHSLQRSDRRRAGDSGQYTRALAHKIKLADILKTLGEVAPQVEAPLVTMVSYAIVYRHGLEKYVDDVQQRGLAGLIVPDLPVEESAQLAAICGKRDVSLIQLVTPTTPRERAVRIAETSTGFLYYVSVAGITGERTAAAAGARRQRRLAPHANRPADLHRLRHQQAGAREAARARGRRPDRRLGHRAANRSRGREAARASAARSRRLRGRAARGIDE